MSMDAALQTYIEECRELLAEMETDLLTLESLLPKTDGAQDTAAELAEAQIPPDIINRIFRAAHTVKGSAGVFGLQHIVSFTHEIETLLDQVRDGELSLSRSMVALLVSCNDHSVELIEALAEGKEEDPQPDEAAELITKLQVYTQQSATAYETNASGLQQAEPENNDDKTNSEALERIPSDGVGHWHISLRFHDSALVEGMDPLSFLRYLEKLGTIISLVTLANQMPDDYNEFDPEACYLGFEIGFVSDASKSDIEDVFEFIRDDSLVRIIPPHAELQSYLQLIDELDTEPRRLGEILVECGSLSQDQLEQALALQQEYPHKTLGEILVDRGSSAPQLVEAAISKQVGSQTNSNNAADTSTPNSASTLRVDAQRVDELINLIGELVTAGASTAIHARGISGDALSESVINLNELIEEVRDAAMRLRMVEIGSTFNRFKRVVRDVSTELGKQVNLTISGADTELDKTVIEKIGDPLMHLVRNALDHGIESPEQRQEAGKSTHGNLHLNAYHDSGSIVIEITDDGAGINAEKVRAKAVDRGLITAEQKLSEHELQQLIFEPGFSTAQAVTNLSGRGVGMDVVRSNINDLGGRIDITSSPGKGTTLTLHVPLTLAIIDGFLVAVEQSPFVIPLDSVRECVELEQAEAMEKNGRQYMNLRNEVLPFVRLRDLFGSTTDKPTRENVVVVHYGNQKAGIVVDQLHGELQTVIKPLGQLFNQLQGIGGSSIMGNGEVALILDIPSLMQLVTNTPSPAILH